MELGTTPYKMGKDIVRTMLKANSEPEDMFRTLVDSGISTKHIQQAMEAYRKDDHKAKWA